MSYEQGVNHLSHLSKEEVFANYLGYIKGSLGDSLPSPFNDTRQSRMTPPSSWSWVGMGNVIGPVTNQGACGSCTTFAVIGTMEAHMRIWYGVDTKLSEQEAVQCSGGCGGAFDRTLYDYAKNGAANGDNYKYDYNHLEPCNFARPRVAGSKVLNFYWIERGADAVKNGVWHLANVGPLATYLCIPPEFQSYRSGVLDVENRNDCGWHAVMVVGYGSQSGKDYWLIRNSWGK